MITAVITNPSGAVVYNVQFFGVESILGTIVGLSFAVIAWNIFNSVRS
jgi:hypothetical protein